MSADSRSIPATESKESSGEGLGHSQPHGDMLSGQGETVPMEASREPTHIKTEPEELHLEGASREDGAAGARSWVPLSPGSKEKPFFLPGGGWDWRQLDPARLAGCPEDPSPPAALPSSQFPVLSREGRTRDRQMAAALLTAWSQMPVTFEDVALYLSREEWGRLGPTQQNFYRDVLPKSNGLAFGFPFTRPFWVPQVQETGEAASCSQQAGAEKEMQVPGSGAVEVAKAVPTLALAALGDVKPFRTKVALWAPGDDPQCRQQAASGQGAGLARDAGPLAPREAGPRQAAPPDMRALNTWEKPSEEKGAQESGEEGQGADGDAGKKTYKCEQCGKAFSWHSHLVTHRRTHTGEKPYACTDCGKRFGRSSHLIQHQIIHTGEKPYTCPSCWKSFSHHSTLIQHQRIHTGEKPYVCERCAKRFTRRSDLVTHQGTHTGAKPHKCPVCGKCFTQSSALVTHQRTHTGVKPYPCPECGKCFSQRSNLIAHNRTHTGEKPYHCLDCGKSFSHSSHLTAHQRTHRGVRPYPCPLCGKSFSRRSNLHRHEKIHTTGPKALAMLMLGAAAAGALAAPPPAPT